MILVLKKQPILGKKKYIQWYVDHWHLSCRQKVNNSDSLKAGLRGPTLMEDFMMREKIMHFGKSYFFLIVM